MSSALGIKGITRWIKGLWVAYGIGMWQSTKEADQSTSPTITWGAGVPTHTANNGSVYYQNDPGAANEIQWLYFGGWSKASDVADKVKVANNTGAPIAAGKLVYLASWDATNSCPEIVLADNTDPLKQATHVVTSAIATGTTGYVEGVWTQTGINTSGYSAADVPLYLTTAGGVSESAPSGSTTYTQQVGIVGVKSATVGVIIWYPGQRLVTKVGTNFLQNLLDTAAPANYWSTDDIQSIVDAIKSIIGGTNQTTRSYSSETLQEPQNNGTLVASLGSEMLVRRNGFAYLVMDRTDPPTDTAGRGLVENGGVVAAQGVPDLTVQVSTVNAWNNAGEYGEGLGVAVLSGFAIPAVGGQSVIDVVVWNRSSGIVLRAGTPGAPGTFPTLTSHDVPLAQVTLTNGVDTSIQAGNIVDLRQTADSIDPTKLLPIPDAGNYYTATELAAMLQELVASALGGTSTTVRAYSGGVLQEPPDNATLTAAIASLMLLRRDADARLVMDETTPPTATAGRGLVISGGGVTPQGAPDNTVAVASGVAYNHHGKRLALSAKNPLTHTTPNGLGGNRYDIIVIPASGGDPVIREGAIAITDPVLTDGDVPLARVTCAPGAFTIAGGDIADLRQTADCIDPTKLLPIPDAGSYYTATELAAMLQELFSAAIGGTNSATRTYAAAPRAVANNDTLTVAIGKVDQFAAQAGVNTDSGVTGISASGANTVSGNANITSSSRVDSRTWSNPAAKAVNVIPQKNVDFNETTWSNITQPDEPRNVQVVFSADWDGGNVQITGLNEATGDDDNETIADPGGAGTVEGVKGWRYIRQVRNLGTRTNGTVDVQTGPKLAVNCQNASPILLEAYEISTGGRDTGAAFSGPAQNGLIAFTSEPNGVLDFYASWQMTIVSTDSGHTHAAGAITVTDTGHVHSQN